MTHYVAAYALFWAALFGYLLGLTSRQRKLNERAARLRERLLEKARATESEPGGEASSRGAEPEERR